MVVSALLERYADIPSLCGRQHTCNAQKSQEAVMMKQSSAKGTWECCRYATGNCQEELRRAVNMTHQIFTYRCSRLLVLLSLIFFVMPTKAAFINFENCIDPGILNSANPKQLQFVPMFFWATYNASENYNFNVTVYGNVTGIATKQTYPSPDDPQWTNPNCTVGKIVNVSKSNNKYSTLFTNYDFLSYTPYSDTSIFCNSVVQGECPLGPVFYANESNPKELRAFSKSHIMYSSYGFTTFSASLKVTSGDASNAELACITAYVTPDLGSKITNFLRILPLSIMAFVAFATAFAAVYCPWGTSDIFRWTTNYGRDEDLLRLVTPGLSDCLQYIQFVLLTGGLSLSYPGFYQPVVSKFGWSALLFNESFVSHGHGTQSLRDGIYVVNATKGLDRLGQLIGMTSVADMWASMVIWLLTIIGGVVLAIQLGFLLRWGYRHISKDLEEDLRAKNIPFTLGMVVRILFNYFQLPVISLSMFQFVVASSSSRLAVAFAAALLAVLLLFAVRLLYVIVSARPRSYLFDDLPTVLLYGPLYNTYSDDAATFALIPIILNFVRGIAIGAVQASGIAQLVMLAICEVVFALTLNAFRPFPSPTSMNLFHTLFASFRLLSVLLSVAFVPTLEVSEGTKGWIGYLILLMHGFIIVFIFFLNAIQTAIEVTARQLGAGGDGTTATRGGLVKVFGKRQLSRRVGRVGRQSALRQSINSEAAILQDQKSIQLEGRRARSLSGSSTLLLNGNPASTARGSVVYDGVNSISGHQHTVSGSSAYTPSPTTPRATSAFSFVPAGHTAGGSSPHDTTVSGRQLEIIDPYYRPPRTRRSTLEPLSAEPGNRSTWAEGDSSKRRWSENALEGENDQGPSNHARNESAHSFSALDTHGSPGRPKTDYAVREVDFYYGVRGPALSNQPTRRLKTGPADPTGPVSSATGWFKTLFRGKTKEKGKGFEVIRSSRAPPPPPPGEGPEEPPSPVGSDTSVPYHDDPENAPATTSDNENGDGDITTASRAAVEQGEDTAESESENDETNDEANEESNEESNGESNEESNDEESSIDEDLVEIEHIPSAPPLLPAIDTGGDLLIPTRGLSRASRITRKSTKSSDRPEIPRKSSKRKSLVLQTDNQGIELIENPRLSAIHGSPSASPHSSGRLYNPDKPEERHLHPSRSASQRLPFGSVRSGTTKSSHSSDKAESSASSIIRLARSENAGPYSASSALGSHASDTKNDRPSTMGYVPQHRLSENIYRASIDEQRSFIGSRAELVDDQQPNDQESGSHDSK